MLAAGGRVQRVLAITIAMVGALGALAVAPTSATAAGDDPDPALAPIDPVIASGEDLVVEVSIGTATSDDLDVDVLVGGRAIATRTAFSQWIEGTTSPSLATVATATIPAGQSRVEVTVPAADLPWSASTSGAMLLAADVEGVDDRLRSLVTLDLPESGPTRVAFTLPTTTPETESGLLTAEELEAAVSDRGTLAAQLAVGEAGATLGVDPIVPASIAALGDDAPEDAVAWLEAVSALPQTYAVPFGGADPIAIAQSGTAIPGIVGIPATDDDGEPIVQPAALAQVPTTTAPVVDATDAAVDGQLLSALAAGSTVILDTDDLDERLDRITPDAHATVAGADVLVADAELQSLVRTAVTADGAAAADARAQALALLATITREAPALQRTLVAAMPADADPEAAQALLAEVAGTSWLEQTSIAQAYAEPARDAELVPTDASAADRDAAARIAALVASAASAEAVGTTLVDPESLIAPVRLQLLAAIATTSRADDAAAVTRFDELVAPLREPVAIVEGGDTAVLSATADLQITLENRLDADVTVELVARTGTNAVTVPTEPIEVDVAAGSRVRVPVSVDVVAAGSGVIRLEVRTPEGVALDAATLRITTQPAFETILLVVVGLAATLLLGFGIFRSIRKRRAGVARGDIDPRTEQLAVADARDAASAKRQAQHDDAPGGRG